MKQRIVEDASIFFDVLDNTPQETKKYVSKSLEIANAISLLLQSKGMTQKDLAQKLGKFEAEVSKWLSGNHNFTLRTIVAIETALGAEIIVIGNNVID